MKIWVNLNTYNEKDNIIPIARAILGQPLDQLILGIVDDNSPDGTGQLADTLAHEDSRVIVIHRPRKDGVGPAYRAGFHRGMEMGCDYFFQIDGDFSHDPQDLPRLAEALNHCDMVIGSRYVSGGRVEGVPRYRQWISRLGNWYIERQLHLPLHDVTAGYIGYRREALERLQIDTIGSRGYAWQIETKARAIRAGLQIAELPIIFRERRANVSKYTWEIARECLRVVKSLEDVHDTKH